MTLPPDTLHEDASAPALASDLDHELLEELRWSLHGAGTDTPFLALIGAGLSLQEGIQPAYPSYPQLLSELQKELRNNSTPSQMPLDLDAYAEDDLWRAEYLRRGLPPDVYRAFLRRMFPACERPSAAHVALARLPFRHYLTTNYDDSIECALQAEQPAHDRTVRWDDPGSVSRFLRHFSDGDWARSVVHLHGVNSDPDSFVLSTSDYNRVYIESDRMARTLFGVFSLNRIVFVGFSLKDPELGWLLRHVNAMIRTGDPSHYALLPAPSNPKLLDVHRKRMQAQFGVTPIFYVVSPAGSHAAVTTALEWLAAQPAPRDEPAGAVKEPRATADLPDVLGAKLTLQAAPGVAHWSDQPGEVEDDNRAGQFGGSPSRNGLALSASVKRDSPGWFRVDIEVRPTAPQRELDGTVHFYYHDTFSPSSEIVRVRDGVARTHVICYGGFTLGAVADEGKTPLELDLARIPGVPRDFRDG